jgi:hypothetical protein
MEEKRKGLFTSEEHDFIATAIYFWLQNKIKSKFFKLIGLKVCKLIIGVLDNYGLDKIPEQWKLDLIPIISAAMKGDKEKVRLLTVDLLNKKVDIPKLDEAQELIVFDSFSKFVVAAIDLYMQKNNNN